MTSSDDEKTAVMRLSMLAPYAPSREISTLNQPFSLTARGEAAIWAWRLRLFATAAASMVVAAVLTCSVASLALERFGTREQVLRALAAIATSLIVVCAALSGVVVAMLVRRFQL